MFFKKRNTTSLFLTLGKEIHRGTYSSFYEDPSDSQRWVKKSNPYRIKKYPPGITISYPMPLYTLIKHGIPDMIHYEYKIIQALHEELRPYVLKNVSLGQTSQAHSVLFSDRVMNFDGKPAKSMKNLGKIENPYFWNEFLKLTNILEQTRTYLFGIFSGGTEIFVQRLSTSKWKPILVDVTRVGRATYRFHPELLLESYLKEKFTRRMKRFFDRHR